MGTTTSKESTASPDAVDLRDHAAIKATLDEYAIELLKKAGYVVDHKLEDASSGMAIAAVLLALLAQFWPYPETKDTPMVLIPCIVGYFSLTSVLAYISNFVVKDTIARTASSPGLPGLTLRSSMKSFDDYYALKLTMGREEGVRKEYIGKLFDEDGEIQLKTLSVMVNELLHEMDAPSESSNDDSKKEQ